MGEPLDERLDVGAATRAGRSFEVDVYEGTSVLNAGGKTGRRELVSTVLSPLAQSEVGTIRGIAMNVGVPLHLLYFSAHMNSTVS